MKVCFGSVSDCSTYTKSVYERDGDLNSAIIIGLYCILPPAGEAAEGCPGGLEEGGGEEASLHVCR